jgi:cysteine sulfinate desulfinase/cysteine desulfurase-like protein
VRLSLGWPTTAEEVDTALRLIPAHVARVREHVRS